jgi:hypothetical protein
MIPVIPGIKDFPNLRLAFDAEISSVTRSSSAASCAKCANNQYLKIVRKYQRLVQEAQKGNKSQIN